MTQCTNTIVKTLAAGFFTLAIGSTAHATPYLCPPAKTATVAEANLMGAITRVFKARWLVDYMGLDVTVGADCADLVTTTGERFKLYRVAAASYELDTSAGEMVGRVNFDRLSNSWQTTSAGNAVTFYGSPGLAAMCDGPASPKAVGLYNPGQCFSIYKSVRYADNVAPVITAFGYIFSQIAPAEIVRSF
jgi:hypothetical protein